MIKNRLEWLNSMREVSLLPKPPIEQKNGKWTVVQRKETWEALAPRIFDEYLDRLRKLAVDVLRERDPQFELEPDQRFAARVYEKTLKHSDELRTGISETLALLGSFPEKLTACSDGKAEGTAIIAVREILNDADWVLWASLDTHLPMLAEAAPDEFLAAVEKAVVQAPSPFSEMFAQESGGVMGRNYMAGLLWALESLAWNSDYLTRVIVLLGDLAAIDPGGNWVNRPGNSIIEILLPWHPQTCADVTKRKAAVVNLLQEHPTVGWKLLLSLLPKTHGVASGTRKPKWRPPIIPDSAEKVTNKEYWEQVDNYAQLAVNAAEGDLSKLTELIQHIPNLSLPAYTRLLDLLAAGKTRDLPERDRRPLWEALVSLVSAHRKFADADWAMPAEAVAKIENVASNLAPRTPSLLYSRIFTDRDFDLMDEKGNYEEQRRAIEKKRHEAVTEIIAVSGVEGVVGFARTVDSPWQVGFSLGVVGDPAVDAVVLPTHLLGSERKLELFAAGFVWGRLRSKGWDWVDKVDAAGWSPEQRGTFLSRLPFNRETWERVDRLLKGDESAYWNRTSANAYEAQEEDLILAAERLLKYGRTREALQSLERSTQRDRTIPVDLVIAALRANLRSDSPENAFTQHASIELIKWLQANRDTNPEELLEIEWSYLPVLGRFSGGSPKALTKRLSQDPNFFCKVIWTAFRSKGEEQPAEEPSEARKAMAMNAYRLLDDWCLPPGSTEDGNLDETAFVGWLTVVKESTQASGHFETAMSQVGQVLPYSPPDPAGLWIHKIVADALNAKDADAMRSGFTCELFNMRGTHGFTGGEEERKIASGYREKADAVESAGFHRLATSIRELAVSYERDAERDSKRGPHDG